MDLNYVAAFIGITTIVVVALLYTTPIAAGDLDCGSALTPSAQTTSQPISDNQRCEAARQSRRNLAHILGAVGLASSVGVFMYEGVREERERLEYQRHPRGEPPHHT